MTISSGAKPGTIRSIPIRVDFLNGDWKKARAVLDKKKIPVKYQTVASVEPYTATIHVEYDYGDAAKAALDAAKIRWEPPKPYY